MSRRSQILFTLVLMIFFLLQIPHIIGYIFTGHYYPPPSKLEQPKTPGE